MKDVVLMKDNLTRRNWFGVKHVFFSHEKTPNAFLISFYLACRFLQQYLACRLFTFEI
jgi:hypothetical protein